LSILVLKSTTLSYVQIVQQS